MIKTYYKLIKPGYIYGNVLTALAGFFLASRGQINFIHLLTAMLGIAFGIASANVFNNFIDRKIDGKMERTKKRALVTGVVTPKTAFIIATVFGIIGVILLAVFTTITTLFVGAVGLFFYEVLYSIAKRRSPWSTLVGAVSGAVPPVAGYTAVTGRIDLEAIFLFLLLIFWQMAHFFAISIYRRHDYETAGIPLLSVVKGISITKMHMFLYIVGFTVISMLFFINGYMGKVYFATMMILSLFWTMYSFVGFTVKNTNLWAKRMFFFSLIINLVFCFLLVTNFWLI